MKTAIYPGTFDPITFGHIDVIKKSLKIFDRVVVGTTDNINKDYYFSIDERLSIIKPFPQTTSGNEKEFQTTGIQSYDIASTTLTPKASCLDNWTYTLDSLKKL